MVKRLMLARLGFVLLLGFSGTFFLGFASQETAEKQGTEKWSKRRLQKGEPSGEAHRTVDTTFETLAEDGENDEFEKAIKITVTLASREKRAKVSKIIKSENRIELYKDRKTQVSSTCRKYGLGKFPRDPESEDEESSLYQKMGDTFPWPPEKSLMYQEPWHLLYCWIHKVASSSWSKVFFNLKGKQVPTSRLHEAAQQFSIPSIKLPSAISNSLLFTIVRHPFERLVSAYRDKFELSKKYAYVYTMYASKILGLKSLTDTQRVRRPTFSEFVDYLLRVPVQQFNDHWVPYWLHCHVCEMEYDIIGKMETIADDMEFIAERSGLAATNITLPWTNRRNSGDNISLKYFRDLSVDQVMGLYRIYKLDFEMFGYQVTPYVRRFSELVP